MTVLVYTRSLVVKLRVVEVDAASDLLMNFDVGAERVSRARGEPRRHGRVRDEVLTGWQLSPELGLEGDEPSLAVAGVHCVHVLPVNVDTIEVVLFDPRGQSPSAVSRVNSAGDGRIGRSESRHHQGDTGSVVGVEYLDK